MAKDNNPLKAGLFIVISFAIACAVFFGITGSALFSGKKNAYTVDFELTEDVSGLEAGSEVRLGGLRVGTVKSIDVVDAGGGRNVVRATFSAPAKYPIRSDAVVSIQAGLTGTVNLNVRDLGRAGPAAPGEPLDGRPDALSTAIAGFDGVGGQVTRTLQDWRPRGTAALDRVAAAAATADATLKSADATIKQVQSKVDPGYEKYAKLADSTGGAMANLNDILGDTKGDFRSTMSSLSATMLAVKDRAPTVLDKASAALDDFRGTMAKTGEMLVEAKAVAANAKDVAASVRQLMAANRGRIDEIIASASAASQNLAAATAEVRSAPWRLLYKPKENEVANQNLYDAARQYAEASRKLQDSAHALRDSAKDPNADGATVRAVLDKLDADFANYRKVEATLWERVRK